MLLLREMRTCARREFRQPLAKLLRTGREFSCPSCRQSAGEVFHLLGEFFVHAARGFIHRGEHQLLQHFLVFALEDFRLRCARR